MTHIDRVRTELTGFPGGPGVSTMYFLDASGAVGDVQAFWQNLANILPTDFHFLAQSSGDTIEDTTGDLVAAWGGTPTAVSQGAGSGDYAAPVGAVVRWRTNTILNGHRLSGHTFVVPLIASAFDNTGSVDAGSHTVLETAAANLLGAQDTNLVVWHRPFAGSPATPTKPARPAYAGGHGVVTSSSSPTMAAVLRSRRD